MVKLPNLDELKKMGSGLIEQAKTVKFREMVDKVKSGIESASGKKPPTEIADPDIKAVFQSIYTHLNELTQTQTLQLNVIKKIETQLTQLATILQAESSSDKGESKSTPQTNAASKTAPEKPIQQGKDEHE